MGAVRKKTKSKSGRGVVSRVRKAVTGKKDGGGKRRHGVNYWANKVMVEKLKKRYNKLKFGGR